MHAHLHLCVDVCVHMHEHVTDIRQLEDKSSLPPDPAALGPDLPPDPAALGPGFLAQDSKMIAELQAQIEFLKKQLEAAGLTSKSTPPL